jgi:hypothetical protein
MAIYTVHEPPPRADEDVADPARFRFVRDGFHFWAFLLGPFWMLWYRLWLVLILYLVVSFVLHIGLWLISATSEMVFIVDFLVSVLLGLEASTLRRWTLARRGWATVGAVAADHPEDAERRFFDAWARRMARPQWQPPAPAESTHGATNQEPAVLGLFPQPGGPR